VSGVTYDAGVLIAAERGERAAWAVHRRALERGHRPVIPAPDLAQAWRGGPQPQLSRVRRGCRIEDMTETLALAAGTLLAATGSSDIVDATVVASAASSGDVILTSDRDDLRALADVVPHPPEVRTTRD
jgi:predicted nucleic acid-binding protein